MQHHLFFYSKLDIQMLSQDFVKTYLYCKNTKKMKTDMTTDADILWMFENQDSILSNAVLV